VTTIYKYLLKVDEDNEIELPKEARPIHIEMESSLRVNMWVLLDPEASKVMQYFLFFGTGHPIPPDVELTYIGTATNKALSVFVWHLFKQVGVK
jgi:hypothetical protein